MAAVQNAGLAIGWAREAFGVDWDTAAAEGFGRPVREGDPLFVPHLTGERTPLLDSSARGAWIGLALEHGRADMLRATYEGVAHGVRHAREALDAEGGGGDGFLTMLGGGSLHPEYRQLLADVLDEPLELLDVPHATTLGAARLAGGASPDPLPAGRVEPDDRRRGLWEARHVRWRSVVDALTRERHAGSAASARA